MEVRTVFRIILDIRDEQKAQRLFAFLSDLPYVDAKLEDADFNNNDDVVTTIKELILFPVPAAQFQSADFPC